MKVLVYGFYKQEAGYIGNLGDNFFKEAFQTLFPEFQFIFTDLLTEDHLDLSEIIIFGGGSFLNVQPAFEEDVLYKLKNKIIFYIGIGAETELHPWHQFLLRQSKCVICRSINFDHLKYYNTNIFYCPDLVYVLSDQIKKSEKNQENSILVLPNAYLIDQYDSPTWKHLAWQNFTSEFAQFLDHKIQETNTKIDFFSMCQSKELNDDWATIGIISRMKNRQAPSILSPSSINNFSNLSVLFSQYKVIISQRLHGLIISDLLKIPFLNIFHHDKLKYFQSLFNSSISYYGINKDEISERIKELILRKNNDIDQSSEVAIRSHLFGETREKILQFF